MTPEERLRNPARVARLTLLAGTCLLAPVTGAAQRFDFRNEPPPPQPGEHPLKLWSRKPATLDRPAGDVLPPLPTGTSYGGALVCGSVEAERIRLLEPELVTFPQPHTEPLDPVPSLSWLRKKVQIGQYQEALRSAERELLARTEARFAPQALCDFQIDHRPAAPIEEYRRELDLRTGVVTVSWREGETRHTRRLAPDRNSGVLHLTWDAVGPAGVSCTLRFAPQAEAEASKLRAGPHLFLKGRVIRKQLRPGQKNPFFQATAAVRTDSFPGPEQHRHRNIERWKEDPVQIEDCAHLELLLGTGVGKDAENASYPSIRKIVLRLDFGDALFHGAFQRWRMEGDVLGKDLPGQHHLPTDERLEAVRKGAEDPALAALLYQYGRYLKRATTLGAPAEGPAPPPTPPKVALARP